MRRTFRPDRCRKNSASSVTRCATPRWSHSGARARMARPPTAWPATATVTARSRPHGPTARAPAVTMVRWRTATQRRSTACWCASAGRTGRSRCSAGGTARPAAPTVTSMTATTATRWTRRGGPKSAARCRQAARGDCRSQGRGGGADRGAPPGGCRCRGRSAGIDPPAPPQRPPRRGPPVAGLPVVAWPAGARRRPDPAARRGRTGVAGGSERSPHSARGCRRRSRKRKASCLGRALGSAP